MTSLPKDAGTGQCFCLPSALVAMGHLFKKKKKQQTPLSLFIFIAINQYLMISTGVSLTAGKNALPLFVEPQHLGYKMLLPCLQFSQPGLTISQYLYVRAVIL